MTSLQLRTAAIRNYRIELDEPAARDDGCIFLMTALDLSQSNDYVCDMKKFPKITDFNGMTLRHKRRMLPRQTLEMLASPYSPYNDIVTFNTKVKIHGTNAGVYIPGMQAILVLLAVTMAFVNL